MSGLIDYAIDHARLTIATLVFLLCAGLVAYVTIAKEAEPDVKIPVIYVQLSQRGISPEDSERLLLRPVETQLKSVGNVKEMRSTAFEGGGFVLLEFEAGFDSKAALADVRAKVDQAKHDLPRDVDEPQVLEVNLSLYPVLVVGLSGDVPERTLLRIARAAKNAIEQAPGVLAAELRGARDEAVEIILDPTRMNGYGLSIDQIGTITQSFNTLIAAGALEGETGRFAVKVPSVFEKPQDILKIPVVSSSKASVTLLDIAEVKPTFKDATSVTRVNGRPAMTIEVSKRTGANLIETVDAVKHVVEQLGKTWPSSVHVTFTQDKSKVIRQMLGDLQNSVATGVLLVAIVILFALGFRASLFIGIAIPASFLAGVLGLQLAGLTINIVVLFSLILAVGMLVDDAIIVSEFAERRMAEGMPPREAYSLAAKRMAGPVIAATATRVAAFSPLLFWPGVVGQFMKYLPITLIATLSASLAVALFFTPTLGALLGKAAPRGHAGSVEGRAGARIEDRGPYMRTVRLALRHPGMTLVLAACLLIVVQLAYGRFGRGVEFFPKVEPDYGQVIVHARGNLSLEEKNRLVGEVERRVLQFEGLKTVYARIGEQPRGMSELTEDTIGVVQFEFADWRNRSPAYEIMDAIRAKTADIPGILIEVTAPRAGPPTGKPVQVQIGALDPAVLPGAAGKVSAIVSRHEHIRDLDDGRPLPGIDWKIEVNKAEAAKYGAGVGTVGTAIQLVTNGLESNGISTGRQRQVGGYPGAVPAGSAQPRCDRRSARPDAGGAGADRQFCAAHRNAARRLHQSRQWQSGDDGFRKCCRRRAVRQCAAGNSERAGQGGSRAGRDLQAQGGGRGACEGIGISAQGVWYRDLLDLRHPAGAIQQAHFGRPCAHCGRALNLRGAARPSDHGAAFRGGHDRDRGDRQCRRHRQQQYRADRYL